MRILKKLICSPLAIIIELLVFFSFAFLIVFYGVLRWLTPTQKAKKKLTALIENTALSWISINHVIFRYLLFLDIEVIGAENINPKKNYFIIANHQSWLDILMIEEALRGRTGFSRYFIKKNLMHIPGPGWAWRVLNYPYMYRFSKAHLAKHPEDKGKDVAITKKACRKLNGIQFKLINFPEGTRFTQIKHNAQKSPYRYLLNPKTGGIAYALEILHEQLDSILDLTIMSSKKPNIFSLFFGNLGKITVIINKIPITPDLIGDYQNDTEYRLYMQKFITQLWQEKDALITQIGDYRKY